MGGGLTQRSCVCKKSMQEDLAVLIDNRVRVVKHHIELSDVQSPNSQAESVVP